MTSPKHVEASAQAALMLVESLALALIERGLLTTDQVVDAVESVIETKKRLGSESEDPDVAGAATGLLSIIANSVRVAQADDERPLRD